MRAFRDRSVNEKLTIVIILVSVATLLLSGAAFLTFEIIAFRRAAIENLSSLGDIVISSVVVELFFDDPAGAAEQLGELAADPRILAACIYAKDGSQFATFRRRDLPAELAFPEAHEPGHHLGIGTMGVFRSILFEGEQIGTLYLRSDLNEIYARLRTYSLVLLAILSICTSGSIALAIRLRRLVSEPILYLADRVGYITDQKDYSVRAKKRSDDEVGALTEAFNQMLTEVENRDRALVAGRHSLERRVVELKQARDAARRATEDLEKAYSDLQEAQDQLLRRERLAALGRMTGTVSHELRNPLGTIQNSLFLLSEKILDKGLGVERVLERLQRNVDRCTGLIDDLLEFSRVRELTRERTYIDAWLEDILAERGVPEGLRVRRELAAGVELAIDRERLRRAMINLLENATQALAATREAGTAGEVPTLTVRSRVHGERLVLEVSDTGPGIPESVLPRVFEPLFSTRSFGVGLGLPTVEQIVKQHGGGVEISSREGHGTTIELWLPLSDQEERGAS